MNKLSKVNIPGMCRGELELLIVSLKQRRKVLKQQHAAHPGGHWHQIDMTAIDIAVGTLAGALEQK